MTRCEYRCSKHEACKRFEADGALCNFKYYLENPERFNCYIEDDTKLASFTDVVKDDVNVKEEGEINAI